MTVQWRGPGWLRRPARAMGFEHLYMRATRLTLSGQNYDDRAVEHLAKLQRLEGLTLFHTELSPAAVRRLARTLPDCRIDIEAASLTTAFSAETRLVGLDCLEPGEFRAIDLPDLAGSERSSGGGEGDVRPEELDHSVAGPMELRAGDRLRKSSGG